MSNHTMVFYGLYLRSIAMANIRCFRRNGGKWQKVMHFNTTVGYLCPTADDVCSMLQDNAADDCNFYSSYTIYNCWQFLFMLFKWLNHWLIVEVCCFCMNSRSISLQDGNMLSGKYQIIMTHILFLLYIEKKLSSHEVIKNITEICHSSQLTLPLAYQNNSHIWDNKSITRLKKTLFKLKTLHFKQQVKWNV